jgi:uncharacterized BrkB/YihY/UPF0761 family membrane protein
MLRNIALVLAGGIGLLLSSFITSYLTSRVVPIGIRPFFWIAIICMNFILFLILMRIATAKDVPTHNLRGAAIMTSISWLVLQGVGSYILQHQIKHLSAVYGTFAIVLGLIFWLYIQAQVSLYAVVAQVVRAKKQWPRSLKS